MAYDATDWTIDRQTGNIRYTGADHNRDGDGTPTYATVIEAHREWQDLADDASSHTSDDELDITDNTPSDRSTNNIITLNPPFNIDDASSEHLYDGSIIQNNGDDVYDGIVNFGNASVQIQIMQNGSIIADDWWNKSVPTAEPFHDGSNDVAILADSGESWTTDGYIGYTVYNTTDGSQALITDNDGTTATGSLYGGTGNDWDTNDTYLFGVGLNADANAGISHRFMIKVRSDGADIDGRRLIGIARRFGNTYSEFKINGTANGNNVLALSDATDLNNSTDPQTVATWDQFVNDVVGFDNSQDIDLDTTNEEYYSRWDNDGGSTPVSPTINQLYEWGKWITTQGTSETMYGISGELFRGITTEIVWTAVSGTFDESSYLVWGALVPFDTELGNLTVGEFYEFSPSGAIGQLLALDDDGTAGHAIFDIESGTPANTNTFVRMDGTASDGATVSGAVTDPTDPGGVGVILADDGTNTTWIQILKGVAPVTTAPLWEANTSGVFDQDAGDNNTTNGTPVDRVPLLTFPFIGASTGTSLIGGYGIGVSSDDLTSSDILFDLGNVQITPPNNVNITVSGLENGEDYTTVNQRGYRFAYDNETVASFTLYETITFQTAGTAKLVELVDQGTTGYMIVAEPSVQIPANDETFTGGTSTAQAIVNGTPASDIDKGQYTLNDALSTTPATSVIITETIEDDTPASGIIRVQDDGGFYRRLIYSSYTGSTFALDGGGSGTEDDFSGDVATVGTNVYIGYIDKLADAASATQQVVFDTNRNLFVRVRDAGQAGDGLAIKTFEGTVQLTSSGASITAIRTSDE